MSSTGSVTQWYRRLSSGDQEAISNLWARYFARLTGLASRKLGHRRDQMVDGEDIALSAFDSLWRGVQNGRFQNVANRNELWRLLSVLTQRKAIDQLQFEHRSKRDVSRTTRQELDPEGLESLKRIADDEPTPESVVQFSEQLHQLLGVLPSDEFRQIAALRLEGYTIPEIAALIDRGHATVERKLRVIRSLWEESSA